LESRVRLSAKNVILFYSFPFLLFLLLLNIFTTISFYLLYSALCDYCFTFSLSDFADQIKKNHVPLPTTEREAAGLISRFVEYIRVTITRAWRPFLDIVVVHRIVLSVAYRLVLLIAYCNLRHRVSSRFPRHISSSLRFAYGHASINELLRSSCIVSILRFKIVDGSSRDSTIPRATPSSQYKFQISQSELRVAFCQTFNAILEPKLI